MIQTVWFCTSVMMRVFLAFVIVDCIWVIVQSFAQHWNILPRIQKALRKLPKWLYLTPITLLTITAAEFILLVVLVQDSEYKTLSPYLANNALLYSLVAELIYLIIKAGELKCKKVEASEAKQQFYKIK